MQALGAQAPCRCTAPAPVWHGFFVRPGQAPPPAGRPQGQKRRRRGAQAARAIAAPAKPVELAPFEAWNIGAAIKKRTDIKTIMILGAGPIVIGQARAVRSGAGRRPPAPQREPRSPLTGPLRCARRPASSTTPGRRPARRSSAPAARRAARPAAARRAAAAGPLPVQGLTPRARARRAEGYRIILLNSNPVRRAAA